ncbi:MAG: VanZ family protein [Salinivirgaceae bacterium]|nr:VanZ family protein [Salinivirgaceae bacterium]
MRTLNRNQFIKLYYKLIVWTLVIAYLCFSPADEFKKVHITIPHFDKLVHFGMFFIAGILLSMLYRQKPTLIHKLWLPLLFLWYAVMIEVIQHFYIYTRSGDSMDGLADILGLFIGWWLFNLLSKKRKEITH